MNSFPDKRHSLWRISFLHFYGYADTAVHTACTKKEDVEREIWKDHCTGVLHPRDNPYHTVLEPSTTLGTEDSNAVRNGKELTEALLNVSMMYDVIWVYFQITQLRRHIWESPSSAVSSPLPNALGSTDNCNSVFTRCSRKKNTINGADV